MNKILAIFALLLCSCSTAFAQAQAMGPTQPSFPDMSFYNSQMASDRVRGAMSRYENDWKKLFAEKKLDWPAKNIYIRCFKADQKFEVYARNKATDTFTHVKTFAVCVLSGKMGPKRRENDKQVPEGYYFFDEFNKNSNYYLSLLVSYPNFSDLIKGDKEAPGSAIYVHGSCVTIGCLPMTDEIIQEIYALCVVARTNGQLNIPIHIFPTYFTRQGLTYLSQWYRENDNQKFWTSLKKGYDYFQSYKKILPVMYDGEGNYVY
jgi:murein L,D-transpeptidase YafK